MPAAGAALPQAPVPSRITAPIDNSVRVTIAGSTHPQAQVRFDRGPVGPGTLMERMILVLRSSEEQEHQLHTLLDSQQTKGSPDYHHWLSPQGFGQHFGPSQQDIAQVTTWLQQQGFSIGSVAKSGRWIEFSGTAAQVNQAFQTQMRTFQVEGKLHTANNSDVSIPAALAPVVQGVASLHDFYSKPMLRRSLQHPTAALVPPPAGSARPSINFSDGSHGVGPGDFATVYNLNPLYAASVNGTGQTIAIVAVSNINTTATTGVDDVKTFQTIFGLAQKDPNIILNGPDPGIVPGAVDEATLDVEWAGAVAPGATIDLVVSGGTLTTDPVLLSATFIVNENLAPIMNVSFGNCEQNLSSENPFWTALWEEAAAQGISVFVSSGDTGAAGCDPNGGNTTAAIGGLGVNGIASTLFNTAVGGTEFNETINGGSEATFWTAVPNALSSAIGYIPERVWNDSCLPTDPGSVCQQFNFISLASGSGGVSTLYGVPTWQTLNITGLTGAGFTHRVLPDVSLVAANDHDPLVACVTDPLEGVFCTGASTLLPAGGTSFASPSFAGIMALINQKLGGPQGLANYVLYPLGATESAGGFGPCNSSNQTNPATPNVAFQNCVFADTTAGNNGVPGNDTLTTTSPGNTIGQHGYNAIAGFDLGTGLGSVNANNLVNAWSKVTFQGSTTTLSATQNGTPTTTISITHGQTVSFSTSVARMGTTGTPTGNVALIAKGGNLTSQVGVTNSVITGSGGTASAGPLTVNNLPGGSAYNIIANYPGDGTFGSSTSNPTGITVSVGAEGTTTSLRSIIFNLNTGRLTAGTTVAYGDPVNVLLIDADTAGLSGLIPASGGVSFTDNNNALTQTTIDNSGIGEIASCFAPLTACLPPGQHTIVATYAGDGLSYIGSTSASLTLTVTPGTVTPNISGPSTVNAGQQFTLTVQALPAGLATITPTGSVQFFDGANAVGNAVTLTAGAASAQITLNSGGVHSMTAKFTPGDNNYNSATSAAFPVTVSAPFTFNAAATSQTIAHGGTATFNVTLNSVGGFTGSVSFNCTGATGGATCAVSPNPANLTSTTTSVALTVTVSNTANTRLSPNPFHSMPFAFAGALALALWGVRKKRRHVLLAVLGAALILGVGSCGGSSTPPPPPPPTTDNLAVTGTSGAASNTINLTLTVTH